MEKDKIKEITKSGDLVGALINQACDTDKFGVIDSNFLCESVSILNPPKPVCLFPSNSVRDGVRGLQKAKSGAIVIVEEGDGKVIGIFSERDLVLKVLGGTDKPDCRAPLSDFMTPDPVRESPTITISYALNLMSHGGFRHLPLVGEDDRPCGILSLKDIVDYIVHKMTSDLLNFIGE